MIPLHQLLTKMAEYCDFEICSDYDRERSVNRVDLLASPIFPDRHTLYLCPREVLPLKDDLLRTILQASEPYLILTDTDDDLPFFAIRLKPMPPVRSFFHTINEYLKFESQLQQEINTLYHLLYSGKGLDDLVIQAEKFLGRPISVLDAGYNMIAVSPLMHQVSFGLEFHDKTIVLSGKEIESLRRFQIESQIYQSPQAFFSQTDDHPDTNWIFCAIRIQHVMSGYIAVCLPGQVNATEHEMRLTTALADICSIEMQKHEFFTQQTGMQYETFLNELIEGRFNDVNMINSRLKLLNHHLGSFFCIIILYSPEPHNSDLFNKRQMSALRTTYPNSMSVVYKNNIVLLLNQDQPVILNEALTKPLEQFASHNHLRVSLSQPFADIMKIDIFYEQAQHTLELADLSESGQLLYFSTEALPEYLFSKCNYKELETGIHYHIFQLQDYDKKYHTEFVPTLRAYLDHDRNATQAAQYLHIHRSTFFYRIKKIEEILDISITDSKLLFLYELSLKIWDYLSK